ncbi:hypothetical protein T492DRAFT_854134, partial [Pavlovales sp. CCMP2436]
GGDTIKFAGDAILVVWGGTQQHNWAGTTFAKGRGKDRNERGQKPLHELLQDAARCCLELVTKYDDLPTLFSSHSLRLHAGLAAGEMSDAANEAK